MEGSDGCSFSRHEHLNQSPAEGRFLKLQRLLPFPLRLLGWWFLLPVELLLLWVFLNTDFFALLRPPSVAPDSAPCLQNVQAKPPWTVTLLRSGLSTDPQRPSLKDPHLASGKETKQELISMSEWRICVHPPVEAGGWSLSVRPDSRQP